MKVICDALALAEACSNVQRAVSTKASIPAIEGILMTAEDHELTSVSYTHLTEFGTSTRTPITTSLLRVEISCSCAMPASQSAPPRPVAATT